MNANVTLTDPIAEAGREIARLRDLHDENERVIFGNRESPESDFKERENTAINDRITALEQFIASGRATTLEGALVQVMVAHAEADAMASNGAAACEGSISKQDLEEIHRQISQQGRYINRILYSVASVLEKAAHADRKEYAGEYYLDIRLDPLAVLDKAASA